MDKLRNEIERAGHQLKAAMNYADPKLFPDHLADLPDIITMYIDLVNQYLDSDNEDQYTEEEWERIQSGQQLL